MKNELNRFQKFYGKHENAIIIVLVICLYLVAFIIGNASLLKVVLTVVFIILSLMFMYTFSNIAYYLKKIKIYKNTLIPYEVQWSDKDKKIHNDIVILLKKIKFNVLLLAVCVVCFISTYIFLYNSYENNKFKNLFYSIIGQVIIATIIVVFVRLYDLKRNSINQ